MIDPGLAFCLFVSAISVAGGLLAGWAYCRAIDAWWMNYGPRWEQMQRRETSRKIQASRGESSKEREAIHAESQAILKGAISVMSARLKELKSANREVVSEIERLNSVCDEGDKRELGSEHFGNN